MKIHTIRDVARAAGVSTATVSRALAPGSARVSEQTRERVHSAVESLGYRANYAARSLKTRITRTVALVAPELDNDFFMSLAEGLEAELDSRGYTMLLASSANSVDEERKRLSILADRMVDGIVVIPAGSRGDHLAALTRQNMPIVLVDRLVEGITLDAVLSDNEAGSFELTRALLADGFKRIAFVGGDITISTARERLSGFARALAQAGIKPEPDWISLGGMSMADGFRHMGAILRRRRPLDALLAVNLLVHLGMERRLLEYDSAAKSQGVGDRKTECSSTVKSRAASNTTDAAIHTPCGLPVIAGFDESPYTPFLPACRYTAAQDAAAIGREAGRCILEKIVRTQEQKKSSGAGENAGNAEARIIRLPVKIIRHEQRGINFPDYRNA